MDDWLDGGMNGGLDAGWTLVGRWMDAGWTLGGRLVDAGWTLGRRWVDAGWMLGERWVDAGRTVSNILERDGNGSWTRR